MGLGMGNWKGCTVNKLTVGGRQGVVSGYDCAYIREYTDRKKWQNRRVCS